MNAENNSVSKCTVSFGVSLAICSVLNALLVVAKEKKPALQAALKKVTGHHWTAHTAIIVILFFLCGALLGKLGTVRAMSVNRLIKTVVTAVVLASLMIIGFYLVAD